jgi:5'-nucleotidase
MNNSSLAPFSFLLPALVFYFLSEQARAQSPPQRLAIIHTNDLQSRLLGSATNRECTPETAGDDATVGGIARLATIFKS